MGVAGSNRHNPRSRRASTAAGSDKPAARNAAAVGRNGSAKHRPRATVVKPLVFTIHSDLAESRDVHKAIMDRVEAQHYDEQSTFAIRLALEEGLMNAIKHGNKLDVKKTVHVEAKVTPKSTEIVIEDQGKGFERSIVPDPCAEENLLKCSGRGILLMEAYMDKVAYFNGGRRVKMVKKNELK
jgi:serine/threonine-protein kinase RsbW